MLKKYKFVAYDNKRCLVHTRIKEEFILAGVITKKGMKMIKEDNAADIFHDGKLLVSIAVRENNKNYYYSAKIFLN